jgi:branched-chain amino acid transport system ATP-binding protein
MSLALRDVGVSYGPVSAVRGVSLVVKAGEIAAVIGPNGAGKTSLLTAVMGLIPHTGDIVLDDASLGRAPAYRRARAGIGFVAGGQAVFRTLTVKDNVHVGARADFAKVWPELCDWFPLLRTHGDALGSALSGGQQQIVGIARAMAARPRFLLLDEPSIGLSPIAVGQVVDALRRLQKQGIGVLLSEQNAAMAMQVSDHCALLVRGEKHLDGSPKELEGNAEVRALYLGQTL